MNAAKLITFQFFIEFLRKSYLSDAAMLANRREKALRHPVHEEELVETGETEHVN
jgi:hypothetical protein